MRSRRKIWSIPIAVLALVLMLAGALVVSGVVQAQTSARVPSSINMVAPTEPGTILVYEVKNYRVPAEGTTGPGPIYVTGTGVPDGTPTAETTRETPLSGPPIIGEARADFTAEFALAEADAAEGAVASKNRITLTAPTLIDGTTYTVKVTAYYDRDRSRDVGDREPGEEDDALDWTDDDIDFNDQDGELVTTVTIHVPSVAPTLQFQADPAKVVNGELISRVGRDINSNPLSFDIRNLGPGKASVKDGGVDAVTDEVAAIDFELSGTDKVLLRAAANNAAAATYAGTITVNQGDTDLDGDDNTFPLGISAVVNPEMSIAFIEAAADGADGAAVSAEGDDAIIYSVTIPESTAPGTGVLPYYVDNVADAITGTGGTDDPEVDTEKITGVIGGASANLFRVNNDTMAIEYDGPENGLTAGVNHVLRLTASGDRGLANRVIVGNVMITVADVDDAPSGVPEELAVTLHENVAKEDTTEDDETLGGLVSEGTGVHDFAGVGADPEGRTLKYTSADGDFTFKENTKMVTVGEIVDIVRGNNPDTEDEDEEDWPVSAPTGWSFADDPVTSLYPDLERTITVSVSDGVPSNDQSIEVTITLKLNGPVTAKAGDAGDPGEQEYETTDVQNHVIVDLNDFIEDGASPEDKIIFDMETDPVNPPFGIYDGQIRVNYPGPSRARPATADDEGWDPEEDGWEITVRIGDKFDNTLVPPTFINVDEEDEVYTSDELDEGVDLVVTLTIKQIPGPPLQSFDLVFEVDENAVAGTVIGSLGPEVEGAETFNVISGTGDARDDFAVDETTGEITVVNGRDYDAVGAENNIVLLVDAFGANGIRLGAVIAGIAIQDIDEAPVLESLGEGAVAWVYETAQISDPVLTKVNPDDDPSPNDPETVISADDPERGTITYSISEGKPPFAIDSSTGALTVSGALDRETAASHTFTVMAADSAGNSDTMEVVVMVLNSNETPNFTAPEGDAAKTTIPESYTFDSGAIFTFTATDEDLDDLTFELREGVSRNLFVIHNATKVDEGHFTGELRVKADGPGLDYDDPEIYSKDTGHRVHVEVQDPAGLSDTLLLEVRLDNVNDNTPEFNAAPAVSLSVPENTARGFMLANYAASDADGDHVYYSLGGDDAKSFSIAANGDLMTLESLDADRQVPCGADGCAVDVTASDGERSVSASVRISVTAIEDSVSTLGVTKANPVPGTEAGHPMSALAGAKTGGDEYLWNLLDCAGMLDLVGASDTEANRGIYCAMWDGLSAAAKATVSAALTSEAPQESPYSLPASYGSSPVNFVETEWANWGTIVRIEVTAESPSATCGNGNQCVVIDVNSDSADTSIKLQAFRTGTQENKFVAALMLVELSENATSSTDAGVYQHTDGGVAALKVDEEDEIEIEFGNLRGSIDVENEDPEISNFAPEHEAAFDDADVDYTFTVTDSNSGMPEPEDLPDVDGDENYTPVVALISTGQCETHAGNAATVKTDGGTLSMGC